MSDRLGELFLQSLSEIYKNHYANYTSNSCKSVSERESVPQESEQACKQTVNSGETASDEEASARDAGTRRHRLQPSDSQKTEGQ